MFGALNVQKFILPGFIRSERKRDDQNVCWIVIRNGRNRRPLIWLNLREVNGGLIPTTTTRPENGKRNSFPQTPRGQSERVKNIFNFLRFSHKYQKLIIRAASKQHEAEIWIPFAICLDMCHHIHLIKAPHLRSHDSIDMFIKSPTRSFALFSAPKLNENVWKKGFFW